VTARPSRDKQRAMKTSIEHIRAKITELEARIADLRIAERELEALDATPAPRTKQKAEAKRTLATDNASEARQTVGAALTEILTRNGALPLAELAEQIRAAGRDVSSGTLSNTLQTMKKRGAVKSAGGKWTLPKTRAKRTTA
jgi:predicted transcriptional regulator